MASPRPRPRAANSRLYRQWSFWWEFLCEGGGGDLVFKGDFGCKFFLFSSLVWSYDRVWRGGGGVRYKPPFESGINLLRIRSRTMRLIDTYVASNSRSWNGYGSVMVMAMTFRFFFFCWSVFIYGGNDLRTKRRNKNQRLVWGTMHELTVILRFLLFEGSINRTLRYKKSERLRNRAELQMINKFQ